MSDCGCEKAQGGLDEYLRQELGNDLSNEIESHLAGCTDCSNEAHIRTVIVDVVRRSCQNEAAPAELRTRVMVALRATSH